MKKYINIAIFFFFITIFNFACKNQDQNQKGNDSYNISVAELKEEMKNDPDLVILDVRTPQELVGEHGKIEGVINIPVQELGKRISELNQYKDKNIAVICRSGNRSVMATKILLQHGFKAKNVMGGMKAYNKL